MNQETDKIIVFGTLLKKITWILDTPYSHEERLRAVCELLRSAVSTYEWVGFYLVDPEKKDELYLGPYAGAETEHTRIKFGQGICGQAAETLDVYVVDDVSKADNYLACSIHVKSEIVLPIFVDGDLFGELDIDSHTTAAFTEQDREFLKKICEMVSDMIKMDKSNMGKKDDEQ